MFIQAKQFVFHDNARLQMSARGRSRTDREIRYAFSGEIINVGPASLTEYEMAYGMTRANAAMLNSELLEVL